ncbi:restriction endonuclease subunit S [Listeria seeligeri]|uniref:restriction endonuclease subunit S n=1 Tax=Listeria seeligeri TaxID=1640 RepID=UPI0001C4E882|nr:restriction endonuclease subunit S [Listeria seeligeri]CBH27915.1 type I restriction-modification system, S subunit [Listeria seeligeri serovar 1/2b str. SLCC3954]
MVSKWTKEQLPNVLIDQKSAMKIGPFGSQLKKELLQKRGNYRVYGQENVYKNDFSFGDRYLSKEKFEGLKSSEICSNDIVISTMGTIGHCAIVPSNILPGIMDSHLIRLRLDNKKVNHLFLKYILQSESIQNQIKKMSVGGIMDGLSTSIIKQIEISYPSINEQKNIAESLSDIDQLINSLSELIKKKESIKNAFLENLVTGARRFKGFDGEWENINLGGTSLLKARIGWQGLTTSEYLESGFSYLITGTDFKKGTINWKDIHFVEKHRYDQDKNIQVKDDDLLLTKDGTIGKVALVKNLNKPATLNSGVFVIRPIKNKYLTEYVYYVLTSSVFRTFLNKLAAGSTISHLYQKDLTNFEFFLPSSLKEQKAVATILSDIDKEIFKLEEKLEKYKKIKQGMMEQLLTGKIRLA